MTPDPQLAFTVATVLGIAWTMYFGGVKKRVLEPKRRSRICPACGRSIPGRVCDAH